MNQDKLKAAAAPNNKMRVFKLDYSVKFPEATKFTTPLGYIYDQQTMVLAENIREAVRILKVWHKGDIPEGIKATDLGYCVQSPETLN
jgi:hypothetical protein